MSPVGCQFPTYQTKGSSLGSDPPYSLYVRVPVYCSVYEIWTLIKDQQTGLGRFKGPTVTSRHLVVPEPQSGQRVDRDGTLRWSPNSAPEELGVNDYTVYPYYNEWNVEHSHLPRRTRSTDRTSPVSWSNLREGSLLKFL